MASAAQLAARKKFARIMKSGGFKKRKTTTTKRKTTKNRTVKRSKSSTTRRKTTTTNRTTPRKSMVKRRTTIRRRTSSMGRGIGSSLKTGVIGDVVRGIGAGSLITLVMSRVAPNSSITPIASTGAAFLSGGIVGGAANLILTGGLSQLGGMFGGASAPLEEAGV